MPGAQMVYNGPLILTLLSAPQAEQEAHLLFQSPRECMPWRPIILGDLRGATVLKK